MDIISQFSAYPEAYQGVNGLLSILRQNIISGHQTEFPFRFTTNLSWSEEERSEAISQITDYFVSFEDGVWTINTL